MISRFYGKKISIRSLRKLFDVSKMGVTVGDMTDAFSAIGMESAALKISIADIYRMPFPAILYWQQRHFVVLYKVDAAKGNFYIADPAEGKIKVSEDELKRNWTCGADKGVVIVAEPGEDWEAKTFPEPDLFKGLAKTIRTELTNRKSTFIKIILLSLVCMVADLLTPLMMQTTVDKGITLHDIGLVWLLAGGQLAVFIGNSAASNIVNYLMVKLGLAFNLGMTRTYLHKLVSLPLSYFDKKSSSELIQKIEDQQRIKNFIISLPQTTFFVVLNSIVFVAIMIWYNPLLFAIFMLFTIFETLWSVVFLPRRKNIDYAWFSQAAENRNNVYELINGITEIKSGNAQQTRLSKWEDTQRRINGLNLKSTLLTMAMSGGQSLLARLKEISITAICATLVINNELTFGEMLTVGYIVGRLSGPFQSILEIIVQVQDAEISYERIDDVMNNESDNNGTLHYKKPTIELKGVGFKYPGSASPFVIDRLDLTVEQGKTTALVGESGCGKTTLIKLMLGFYTPQRGELLLSGVDVTELNRDEWLKHCGVVMQSGYIFSDTIAANIAISCDELDLERVREAATVAGLDSFIDSLPMGYHTRVGSTGIDISGGQKQRLLIARAVYQQPEILFLDEATSSLDATNERIITERLREVQRGKTMIVAAHRLSTVRNADRILFIRDGQIIEQGTHDELISLRGEYYRLVENQLALSV